MTWITITEAAALAHTTKPTVYRWMRDGLVTWGRLPDGRRRVLASTVIPDWKPRTRAFALERQFPGKSRVAEPRPELSSDEAERLQVEKLARFL